MYIGMPVEEIETPALLIDLDAMEKNIETMGSYYRSKKGAALRPHQKGHRLPQIARKQIAAGAVGVSMTSPGLAELYVNSGIDDILITREVYGRSKIARLCGLARHGAITMTVDDVANARQISEIGRSLGARVNVAVEVYAHPGSCGVPIEDVKGFVGEISKLDGIHFRGVWWHEGMLSGPLLRRRADHFAFLDQIVKLKESLEGSGFDVEMLSGGHSVTWNLTPEYSGLKDVGVQAGNYVFSDWEDHEVEGLEVFEPSLTVLTRCISRPRPDEAVFDAGLNSCANESGTDYSQVVGPRFKNLTGIDRVHLREEMAYINCKNASSEIRTGDLFELIPPHGDTTAKMHDRYYGIRNGKVEVIWPNLGRGLL
jgi:D-serine deaminase-like pyridoxal phosphate-dependent protein